LVAVQSYLLALFLFTNAKGKKISNSLLATFLLCLGTQMLSVVLSSTEIAPALERFNGSYGYLYGVLFYFYTLSLIYKDYRFTSNNWLHFLPFVAVSLLPLFQLQLQLFVAIGLYTSILTYLTLSHYQITRYHQVVKNTQSNYDQIQLSWLRLVLTIFSLTLFVDIIQFVADKYQAPHWFSTGIGILVCIGLLALVLTMVYKGLRHPSLFMGISESDVQPVAAKVKYAQESLSNSDSQANLQKLEQYMRTAQPHFNPDLSLQILAQALDMSPRDLSQMINYHLGQNFADFINTHRIEAAKHRLKHPKDDKETILEVLYEVGFNSKSSFNAIFKKKTGMTPTQFKKLGIIESCK
jgi:AraC-like DNA-binding protein